MRKRTITSAASTLLLPKTPWPLLKRLATPAEAGLPQDQEACCGSLGLRDRRSTQVCVPLLSPSMGSVTMARLYTALHRAKITSSRAAWAMGVTTSCSATPVLHILL